MENKKLVFKNLVLERLDLDTIAKDADKIKDRALQHYMNSQNTVAMAWVQAVIEYLNSKQGDK